MKSKQLYFSLIGGIALLVIATGALFYFGNQRLGKTIGSLAEQEEDIQIATKEVANLRTLEQQLARIENIKPEIDAALPKGKTQSEAISQIIAIGSSNGISFRSIQFEETQGLPSENSQTKPGTIVPSVSIVPITLETGSIPYDTLKGFLRDVLAIRRNANVSSLTLARDAERPGRVTARIVIDIHLEKVAAPLTEEEKAKLREQAEAGKE